jgi:hypothetical protein
MKYQNIRPISKQAAENILYSGDEFGISECLISLAYYESDWRWVQEKCLEFTNHKFLEVRRSAILGFAHLARIHKKLDLEIILPRLQQLKENSLIAGTVEDVIEDIRIFILDST